jgi:hypothetical protein
MIYEPSPEPLQHGHTVAFAPGNTDIIYVSYGDYVYYSNVIKLEYTPGAGGKANKDNWSKTTTIAPFNPATIFSDGTYLYFGHDEGSFDPIIWKIDPLNDLQHDVLRWPGYRNNEPNHPYRYRSPRGDCFGMYLHNGVYYATVRDVYTMYNPGMYVSPDGEHWVRAYGIQGVPGFNRVFGYLNGYIWGCFRELNADSHLYKIRPIKTSLTNAIRIERGITNTLDSVSKSSFEINNGGWRCYADSDTSDGYFGRSNQDCLQGDYCFLWTAKDNNTGYAVVDSNYWSIKPSINDYICVSFWIKGCSTWPLEYTSRAFINVYNHQGSGAIDSEDTHFQITKEWQKITLWGKCTDANWIGWSGPKLIISLSDNNWLTGDPNHDRQAQCFIDCAQIVFFNDLHYSGGSWQIGGTPKANETAHRSISGIGSEFTVAFEWRPNCANREWHDDIYIANITDDINHIDLYYDQSESRFVATDGINTAKSTVHTWEHSDSIKFAITNLVGDFRLSVRAPLKYPIEHTLTDNTATAFGALHNITFGTDFAQTRFGCGLFANTQVWNVALSQTEIDDVFENKVEGDVDGDYDVDFRDFAALASHWLDNDCGDCDGTDLTGDGEVNMNDLLDISENWLISQ